MVRDLKNTKSKWIWGSIFLFVFMVTIFVFIFRGTILLKAGKFMAPAGDYKADVAILEGAEFVRTGMITSGMDLLSSDKVKRIIVVLQKIAPAHRPFGINGQYPDMVKEKLRDLGLKEEQFKIIVTPIRYPVTLREAEVALDALSNENIKSAILISPGFHARRSFLVYKYVGIALQIEIFPYACFTEYQLNNWWLQEAGVRDFADELLKLGYYLAGGYIPLKFS